MTLLCTLPLLIAIAVAAEVAVPKDFQITIEDHHGLGEGHSFDTTISADGTVRQRVLLPNGWQRKCAAISHRAVSQLFRAIQQQRFFSLATNYPTAAFDCDTFVIRVDASGRSHRVRFATCFRSRGTRQSGTGFFVSGPQLFALTHHRTRSRNQRTTIDEVV